MGGYGNVGVEAEALDTRAALAGDRFDIFHIDAIPEPHDRAARSGAGGDAAPQ